MNRRGLLVSLALLLGVVALAPASAASSKSLTTGARFSSLGQAVRSGMLNQRVLDGLSRGPVDALVTFQQEPVLSLAIQAATADAADAETSDALVQQMYRTYPKVKRAALKGLTGVSVLQDY